MADEKIDVPRLAKEAGLTRPVAAPVFHPTAAQEKTLERLGLQVAATWRVEVRETILPAYRAGIGRRKLTRGLSIGGLGIEIDELKSVLDQSAARVASSVAASEPAVARFVGEFAAWHTAKFVASIEQATSVRAGFVLTASDVQDITRSAISRNVALIKGIDDDMRRKIERATFDAWNRNDSAKKLTRQLTKEFGFAPARAKLIGRDQVSKLAGELDKARAEDANLSNFIWEHSLLPNPREQHLAWHGEIFKWSDPPDGIIPGQEINCRCRGRPYIVPR